MFRETVRFFKSKLDEFDAQRNIILFSVIVNISIYIFANYCTNYEYIECLSLRIIALSLSIGVILKDYWPHFLRKFFKIYNYFSLVIALIFTSTYLLMLNNYDHLWQIYCVLSIFLVAMLVNWQSFLYMVASGIVLAVFSYKINYCDYPKIPNFNIEAILLFSGLFIIKTISLKSKSSKQVGSVFLNDHINKSLNHVINKKTNDLVQALNNKEMFIINILNEFQQPISSAKQTLHELMVNWDNFKVKDKTKYLAKMYQDLHKLYENINNISSFTQLNSNLEPVEVNFKELLNKLLYNSEQHFFFNQKNIIFKIHFDDKIPACFIADKQKLNHAIELLLDNAIKFSYKNSEVVIRVELEEENFIKFSIENEGLGVPEGEEKIIFQSFVQSTRTKNNHEGKGLGLTIARNIIQAHKGIIWLDTTHPNKKITKVCFIIPTNFVLNNQHTSSQREIICVDDDPTVIDNYKLLLNYENYKNVYFTSPSEALDYINKNFYKIDIILLDLMMPEMHGFKFLSHLRSFAKTKNIPVVINSCISDENDIHKSFNLGANDYIQKPFASQKLYFVLNNYLTVKNTATNC